jgi:hypothetical protein
MNGNRADELLGELAQHRAGVFTRADALAAGLPAAEVRRRLADGLWIAEFQVGLRAATTPATVLCREHAALARGGDDAVLSHYSAARWWRLGVPAQNDVWITVPYRRNPRAAPGLRVVRTRVLPPASVRERDGVRLTSPDRTIADLARFLTQRQLTAVALEAIQRGLCTVDQLAQWRALLAHRAGGRRFAATLEVVDPALESILAAEFGTLVGRAGIPLVAGHRLRLPDGDEVICDFADLRAHIDFEIDGFAYHSSPRQVARDKERDRRLLRAGWVTVRYDADAIRRRPLDTVADVMHQIARRTRDLPSV